ncbi:uncharacterized protein LOC131639102 [Vicia villosa]|uniref:uncharacterized protein LOC131639102 n=1 Tax=Vicia villosa TaxID=3911 RepID=UPI00273C3393|nr:uncharacterized protein LOC131639102 [Vicia villosa]
MEIHDLFPETRDETSKSPSNPEQANQPTPPKKPTTSQSTKSFAQVLTGVCDIPLSQLPNPVIKGDKPSITIPEEEYEAGIAECKNNLHGRVLWQKGSTPLTVAALKEKLAISWSEVRNWGMLSLGKGYYEFNFASPDDMRRVRAFGTINLNPGSLKLFAWTKDFNPALQSNTSAQVWIRLFGLSQEYWRPRIVFAIASCVGTPICIDAASSKSRIDRTFGQYVRVLVDMDLTKDLNHNVLVERKGFAFFADIEYENIPSFCEHCKKLGHLRQDCKAMMKHMNTSAQRTKPIYVQKNNTRNIDTVEAPTTVLEEVIQPISEINANADPIIIPNPLNFISQPESESPVTEFVDASQVLETQVDLHNSWADLADLEEVPGDTEGAFTNAVSIIKKKQAARNKAKGASRSQAGPARSVP